MSEQWAVHLVFTDDSSNKFWRARTEGSTLYVNYGRIGTQGQTSVKKLDSAAEAEASLAKQAAEKRRKGYVDEGSAGAAAEPAASAAPVVVEPAGPRDVTLVLRNGERAIELRLVCDGKTVRTEVVESFDSAEAARAAYDRIEQGMLAEGYQRKS